MEYFEATVNELSDHDWSIWKELVSNTPGIDSPFFRPEFTRQVTAVRDDARIGVIAKQGTTLGFLPYQKTGRSTHPLGGRLSEYHGVIIDPGIDWCPSQLLQACGIRSWHFDHLPDSQSILKRYSWGENSNPVINLQNGFDAYRSDKKRSGSSIGQTERKARKMEREIGPLRFEWNQSSTSVIAKLIEWKTEQHRRTGVLEIFQYSWIKELIENLSNTSEAEFSSPLSALYAGDHLVAVHLGLASRTNLHMWIPTYDIAYQKYSPGLILLLHILESAASRGIERVDFGPGEERFKQEFKTGDTIVHEGMVGLNRLETGSRAIWYRTKRAIRNSRYRNVLEAPLKATRKLRQRLAFRM